MIFCGNTQRIADHSPRVISEGVEQFPTTQFDHHPTPLGVVHVIFLPSALSTKVTSAGFFLPSSFSDTHATLDPPHPYR